MEAFEHKGIFWLPEQPKHEFAGVLKFDPIEGISFETIGFSFLTFEIEKKAKPMPQNTVWKIAAGFPSGTEFICGYTEKGREVTLLDCFYNGDTIATGYVGSRFRVRKVFEGYHFDNKEQIDFESMSVNYSNLEKWLGISGFQVKSKLSNDGSFSEQQVNYKRPDPIEHQVEDLKLKFLFYFQTTLGGNEFPMRETAFVQIRSINPMHLFDYDETFNHIRKFLILGMGQATVPEIVEAHHEDHKELLSDGTEIYKTDVRIHYVPRGRNVLINEQADTYMLFYYYDISDNFGKYLGHWLKKADTLKPVYDLYFGSYYIPSMYAEEEFLTLTRALEAYYRRVHNGRLKFGPTIDAILDQVLNAYKDIVQSIVKDQPYFVTRVTNTRNYLTHHNKKSPANTIKNPSELPDYSQKLRLILQLCFFVEMEFSTDIVETITSRNEMFKQHVR